MKKLFPGYYRKTELDIKAMWENGVILFDANVLLNLYRYSDSTRNTILNLITRFSKQVYLPHQAALEYNRNRYEVIAEQEKAYGEFLKLINQIRDDLQSKNKPPFLSSPIDSDLNAIFEKVGHEVTESITKYSGYLKADPIYNSISDIFKERITNQFTTDELNDLCTEGATRFKNKVPPGYEDEKKDGIKKYGDLILWKQIINKAKELNKSVILITDERKTDWWWKIKDGRQIGPRHELIEEIKLEANADFHMYSSERFLSYGQSFFKEKVNQNALNEIQALKRAEMEELDRNRFFDLRKHGHQSEMNNEIKLISKRIQDIDLNLFNIEHRSNLVTNEPNNHEEMGQFVYKVNMQENKLKEERIDLIRRLDSLQDELMKSERAWESGMKYVSHFNDFIQSKKSQ